MQASLPRMTNQQFDYVEDQALLRHISFKECPTCGSKPIEYDGLWNWPEDSTFKLFGQEYFCNCDKQMELLRHYILADIPKDYWCLGDNENDYWGDPNALIAVKDYFENWSQYKKHGFGLQIYSPKMGVGKTLLASLLAKWLIQQGERVVFVPCRDILGYHKLNDEERKFKLERLRYTPILIIDEVQAGFTEAQRAFMATELEDLLRFRTSGNTVTIVTTNLTPEELENEYPRCFSLLSAKQVTVKVNGEDVRKNGDKHLLDLELIKNGESRPLV